MANRMHIGFQTRSEIKTTADVPAGHHEEVHAGPTGMGPHIKVENEDAERKVHNWQT